MTYTREHFQENQYTAPKVKTPWPQVDPESWNQNMVEMRLRELAKSGVYYDSKLV